jgi:cyclopropane-fatty-acyl-phospholipid synthase
MADPMGELQFGALKRSSDRALGKAMSRVIRRGSLEVVTPSGARRTFGDGGAPHATIRFKDIPAIWELLLDPELRLGVLYMDRRIVVDSGSIYDVLALLLSNAGGARSFLALQPLKSARTVLWRLSARNTVARARRQVAHHYDIDGRIYSLFLDEDRQYSCAYFEHPRQSLDEAQLAKKRHIAAKLRLEPGQRILDIGSGWGGLALYLAAAVPGVEVLGVTLSNEQLAYARSRAERAGLSGRVRFELMDYREIRGSFDRIVSVGMFEHVGLRSYDAYFEACRRLLTDHGIMLLHTIARTGEPYPPNPWITRFIFPGGHIPTVSQIAHPLERSGLLLADLEVLRLHYAWTLRAWRERFLTRWSEAARLNGERFCRMWEFYLAAFEAAFRFEDLAVFQLQLSPRIDAVPVRRDYIPEAEAGLRKREARLPA